MMNPRNSVQLIGRLGTTPELKQTSQGKAFTQISIATAESYRDRNGTWIDKTEWHRITLWDKKAEVFCKRFTKGNEILIQGKLRTRQYEDSEGVKRTITEIVVMEFVAFSKNKTNAATAA